MRAGFRRDAAENAARAEAEVVIQRWNDQLALGRDMLWSPTIRAALLAGTPWLDVFCAGCGTTNVVGATAVYMHGMGTIVRCPRCDNVLIRIVHARGRYLLDMRGVRVLQIAAEA